MTHYVEFLSTKLTCKNNDKGKSRCSGIIGVMTMHKDNSGKGTSICEEEHAKGKSIQSQIIGNVVTSKENSDEGKLICHRIVGSEMKLKLVRNNKIPCIKITSVNNTWKKSRKQH